MIGSVKEWQRLTFSLWSKNQAGIFRITIPFFFTTSSVSQVDKNKPPTISAVLLIMWQSHAFCNCLNRAQPAFRNTPTTSSRKWGGSNHPVPSYLPHEESSHTEQVHSAAEWLWAGAPRKAVYPINPSGEHPPPTLLETVHAVSSCKANTDHMARSTAAKDNHQHGVRACILTCSASWRDKESSNKSCQWLRNRKTTQTGTKFKWEIKRWNLSQKVKGYLGNIRSQKEPQRFVIP